MSGIRINLEVKRANVCHSKNAKILTAILKAYCSLFSITKEAFFA